MNIAIDSFPVLAGAATIAALAIVLLLRSRLGALPNALFAAAAVLLLIAIAQVRINRVVPPSVVVMVDLSPSTRSAEYRDSSRLRERIEQLLPGTHYRAVAFASANSDLPNDPLLNDVQADRTIFNPPPGDAIVLFSDGVFDLPSASPPVFAVIDQGIVSAGDAAINHLELRGEQVVATVTNNAEVRQLSWRHISLREQIGSGRRTVVAPRPQGSGTVSASLNSDDLWPENDFAITQPIADVLQRTWIGGPATSGWHNIAAGEVNGELADFLTASAIVIDAPAAAFTDASKNTLARYVRDLGGTLILRGGERGFSAGGWTGSVVDEISPLSAAPPTPTHSWLLLIDSSGSMSAPANGATRFEQAVSSVRQVLSQLPPEDLAIVGSFAESLRPWTEPSPVRSLREIVEPPPGLSPHGPTNLEPMLQSISGQRDALQRIIILISDADARISDPLSLASALRAANARLFILAIGSRPVSPQIDALTRAAAGALISQDNPAEWSSALGALAQSAIGEQLTHVTQEVEISPPIDRKVSINRFNRSWPRQDVNVIARSNDWPIAAEWRIGAGRVVALAFDATPDLIGAFADAYEAPPRDPRFKLQVVDGANTIIRMIATMNDAPMNDLAPKVTILSATEQDEYFRQVAPGRYEVELGRASTPRVAVVKLDNRIIDRIALPGRHAAEFDRIGLDRAKLLDLAQRSGGAVIEPDETTALNLPRQTASHDLTRAAACISAVAVLLGLLAAHYARRKVM